MVDATTGNGGLLDDLYKEIILDHYRNPRNRGELTASTCSAEGANPLCGDQVTVAVRLGDDRRIEDVRFAGSGCSISQASASMMTEYVKGKTPEQALHGAEVFQRMMHEAQAPEEEPDFDDIEALVGVAKFPARVKCASLAWKTLERALEAADGRDADGPISTEDPEEARRVSASERSRSGV